MVNGCHSPKFGVNSFDGFQENGFDERMADGKWMTDARATTIGLLCNNTKQS